MSCLDIRNACLSTLMLFCSAWLLSSCVMTYRDFPEAMIGKYPTKTFNDTLHYQFKREAMLDGPGFKALETVFQRRTPFSNTAKVNDIPKKGIYCLVETKWKMVGGPAAFFGYLSWATLTLSPSWSTREGHHINYHLYLDGEKQQTFQYEVTRKVGVWLGLLPFAWINFLTYDQGDAFSSTAYQFFEDARPHFTKHKM
jgi:hypothetical protein